MRSNSAFPLIFTILLVVCAACASPLQAQTTKGTVITVNDVGDTVDASPGDGICADANGKCTLRAAIAESNASAGTDAIIFDIPVPAIITLTLGELQITNPVGIYGRGARNLTIQRTNAPNAPLFRLFNISSATTMRDLTLKNGSSGVGGAILTSALLGLSDMAITGNRANAGGGIAFQASPLFSLIERCLINSNVSSGQGGGIYTAPTVGLEIKSSTITNNSAVSGGGVSNNGWLIAVNDTIVRNSASQGVSSLVSGAGSTTEILNSIVGADMGQTGPSVEGQFSSLGSNIITNTTGSSGWISTDQVSSNNSIDPMLGNLADNGGQTDSIGLLAGSPAIDRGDNCVIGFRCNDLPDYSTRADQRNFSRAAGSNPAHVDIGALEFGSSSIVGSFTTGLTLARNQRLAFSRVTVINTETMEKRYGFVTLEGGPQHQEFGIQPMSFQTNTVYVIDIRTKRGVGNPRIITF